MAEPAKLLLVESTESYNVPRAIELSSDTTTLGRSSKMCSVVLDATPTKSISRKHAEIVCTKGGRRGTPDKYILRDLGSTNGVFVNEVKIDEQPLEHDDVVQFGGAADIPVGTRFGGTGSHIRYRFVARDSRKRRQSDEPIARAPAAQRARKNERANTITAIEALRAISNGESSRRTESGGSEAGSPASVSSVGESAERISGGSRGGPDAGGETPALVMEVLGDAMCGLCSELLLDAGVLPCSHSFCRLCWADHVEEKGTTCPVCLRKMHSSERNPRRCSSLDLLVTSIVHKLAGPRERERWKARQEHAQKREAAAAGHEASRNGPTAAARKAAPASGPSPGRGVPVAENGGASNGPLKGNERDEHGRHQPQQRGAPGTASRRGNSSRSSGGGGGGGRGGGAAVAVAVAVKCEGCNEEGHDFGECPHRSDSALEGSGEEDEEEEDSDEYQDEEEDDDEEGDEDYRSGDA